MRARLLATIVVTGLALVGCGGDDVEAPSVTAQPLETPSSDPTGGGTDGPTDAPTATETPTAPASPTELAGEPYDGPPVGGQPAELDVVGVAADDVLNVRLGPGTDQPVIAMLAPLETDVPATGRGRLLPQSIWLEVEVDGTTGWLSSSFVGYLGGTDDITSAIVAENGGELPGAETLLDLAEVVAAFRASEEPASRIVVSDGPDVGDLGEVTVDVIGLGDDAGLGLRLVVFATEDDSGDGWTVKSVESTQICGRGEDTGSGCP